MSNSAFSKAQIATPVSIANGGTAATTASGALLNLGVVTTVVQTGASVSPTATTGIYNILCDATSNAITVNLPTAVGNVAIYNIKKTDSSSNAVTVDASGTQTIDGSLTAVISIQNVSITLVSDNSNWKII